MPTGLTVFFVLADLIIFNMATPWCLLFQFFSITNRPPNKFGGSLRSAPSSQILLIAYKITLGSLVALNSMTLVRMPLTLILYAMNKIKVECIVLNARHCQRLMQVSLHILMYILTC